MVRARVEVRARAIPRHKHRTRAISRAKMGDKLETELELELA